MRQQVQGVEIIKAHQLWGGGGAVGIPCCCCCCRPHVRCHCCWSSWHKERSTGRQKLGGGRWDMGLGRRGRLHELFDPRDLQVATVGGCTRELNGNSGCGQREVRMDAAADCCVSCCCCCSRGVPLLEQGAAAGARSGSPGLAFWSRLWMAGPRTSPPVNGAPIANRSINLDRTCGHNRRGTNISSCSLAIDPRCRSGRCAFGFFNVPSTNSRDPTPKKRAACLGARAGAEGPGPAVFGGACPCHPGLGLLCSTGRSGCHRRRRGRRLAERQRNWRDLEEGAHGTEEALVAKEERLHVVLGPEADGERDRLHRVGVSPDEEAAEEDPLDVVPGRVQVGKVADVVRDHPHQSQRHVGRVVVRERLRRDTGGKKRESCQV